MTPFVNISETKERIHFGVYFAAILAIFISCFIWILGDLFDSLLITSIVGGFCLVLIIAYCIITYWSKRTVDLKADAVFLLNRKLIPFEVQYYSFSADFSDALNSVFQENEAFFSLWKDSFNTKKDKELFNVNDKSVSSSEDGFVFIAKGWRPKDRKDVTHFKKYVIDAVEYVFLHWLSSKLDEYYNADNQNMDCINRDDISDYVLKNKVVDLLSRDFSERVPFLKIKDGGKEMPEEIHAIYSIKTRISYEKFELLLPKGTKIKRNDLGELVISHRYFKIQFKCDFDGFSTALPSEFEELILGCHMLDIKTYLAPVSLRVTINPIYFLFSKNYNYLKWIDSMCNSFVEKFSFDKYLQAIDFNTARTVWYMRYGVKRHIKGGDTEENTEKSIE